LNSPNKLGKLKTHKLDGNELSTTYMKAAELKGLFEQA